MSKQVNAKELAEIVTRLLTDNDATGELCEFDAYQGFMTDIARVICDYCGGEVRNPADPLDDIWYVGVHGNKSLPDGGGIWKGYDREGELCETPAERLEEVYGPGGHPDWPWSEWQYDVGNRDTQLGYWDWVWHNLESEADRPDSASPDA